MVMQDGGHKAEPRSSYIEGARDVAVLEAMLESSGKQGAPVQVKRFQQIWNIKQKDFLQTWFVHWINIDFGDSKSVKQSFLQTPSSYHWKYKMQQWYT